MLKQAIAAGTIMASAMGVPFATEAKVMTHPMPHTKPFMHVMHMRRPGMPGTKGSFRNMIIGSVSAISGTSLTVTGTNGTTYTVDASQAKLMQGMGARLSLSNVQTGDKVMVMGTINGTAVTAKRINDTSFMGRNIFSGSVTAINGSLLTISGRDKTSYTLDASAATITKGRPNASTTLGIADIKVGDRLTAVGSLNGSSVSATSIFDAGQFQWKGGHLGART